MRKVLRFVATLGLLLGSAIVLAAAPAVAAPRFVAQTGPCPGATGYPVSTQAMIKASTTTPYISETIEVSGQAYCPNEDVKIYLNGKFKLTAHTDAAGSFDPALKIGGPVGDQTLSGVGASGLSNDRDSLILHVRSANGLGGESTGAGSGSGSGSGLSNTGVDIALLVALAALLVGAGYGVNRLGRRRSAH